MTSASSDALARVRIFSLSGRRSWWASSVTSAARAEATGLRPAEKARQQRLRRR